MQNLNIQTDIPLQNFNTFGIQVNAQHFMRLKDPRALQSILTDDHWHPTPKFILGGGSNILFTKDYPGLVIKNEISGIEIIDENNDHIYLKIGAGENWHQLVMHCVQNQLGGVENLSLIPGTVGAAPMQNIGAYGVEIRSVFHALDAIELATGKHLTVDNEQCQFGYRNSIFKNTHKDRFVITHVTLRLNKKPKLNTSYAALQQTLKARAVASPTIRSVSEAVIEIRQRKLPDPKTIPNAGSFFKNPFIPSNDLEKLLEKYPDMPNFSLDDGHYKIPAAWLIEQCGWKGKRRGSVGVHDQQALVLVNHDHADGNDVKKLAQDIQKSVLETFNISLSPEVNIIN